MNKSFKNLSKLALGATLVTSALMGSTGSVSASEIATSENMGGHLVLGGPAAQYEVENDPLFDSFESPMERANHLALEESISNNGNSWFQPGGYKFFRANFTNTSNEDLKVSIEEDGYSEYWGTVRANTSKTFVSNQLVLPANGKRFAFNYTSPTGKVSGSVRVRVSNIPF